MRFQTKIFLWMLGALVAILVPTLMLVKAKLRDKAEQNMAAEFQSQVELVLSERAERLADVKAAAQELAQSPLVKRSLAGQLDEEDKRTFSLQALAMRAAGKRNPGAPNADRDPADGGGTERQKLAGQLLSLLPVLCTVDLQGGINELTPQRPGRAPLRRTMELRHDGSLRNLPDVSEINDQQIGYVISEFGDRSMRLREVVATPVEEDGKVSGVFVMGIDAETPLDHLIARLQKSSERETSTTGFFAEGRVVQLKGLREIDRDELARLVAAEIRGETGMSEIELAGEPYRFAWQELNPGSILPSAHEISFFPLSEVRAEIADMQRRLLVPGAAALLVAAFASFFIARGLAKPVTELERATRLIGGGDYSVRIQRLSNDELGRLGASFNEMAEELALKERYREVLAKVSDEAVAQSLIEGTLELGGETRFLTVLFCDIRGFTALTGPMDPQAVIDLLNAHMTAMTDVVYAHKGVVDKFVGDEIMAIFGAPKAYGDDPANALRCALSMIKKRAELNAGSAQPFEVGIGVASGEMVAGCMGSVDRLNYTVVGEPVNLASRLCSKARPGTVLAAVDDGIADGEEVEVEVKGFSGKVKAIRVTAVRDRGRRADVVRAD